MLIYRANCARAQRVLHKENLKKARIIDENLNNNVQYDCAIFLTVRIVQEMSRHVFYDFLEQAFE